MKKFLKIFGIIILILFFIVTGALLYVSYKMPNVGPADDIKISATPEMIERGKYLAHGFAACMDCHSKRDLTKFSAPIIPGTEGMGGDDFGEGAGTVLAKNITPDKETGIGNWTDGEILRAITSGVDKAGEPLGPMMPYHLFAKMGEQDLHAIVAYLRTLKPIHNPIPKHDLNFPVNFIFRMLPEKPEKKQNPDPTDRMKLGEYYALSCYGCHTPFESGKFDDTRMFAGGREFHFPDGSVIRAVNISPDKETGIGNWTKQQFVDRFRFYQDPKNIHSVKEGEFNTIMPWSAFANLKTEDLEAIYDYLMSQPAHKNAVVKWSPKGTTNTANK